MIEDNEEMANSLNEFFVSVFTAEDISCIPNINPINDDIRDNRSNLYSFNVREDAIIKKISKLKKHSAPGPDNIMAIFLQETVNEIAYPLKILFQKFLDHSTVPEIWKKATLHLSSRRAQNF